MRIRFALLLLTLLLAGCVSTQKRYDRAVEREAEGRYEDAAELYLKVLRKDTDFADAAERLAAVGDALIDRYLRDAREARAAGRYEEAARALDRLERLRRNAAAVDVDLAVPDTYAALYDAVYGEALEALLEEGRQAEARRDWAAALQAYERAGTYARAGASEARVARARAGALGQWAEDDLRDDRYRSAFDRAQAALDLFPADTPLVDDLLALQEDALAAGTRAVAYVPFSLGPEARDVVPRGLLQDFNDVLLYEHLAAPPLFVALYDPVETRRVLRQRDLSRRPVSDREAAQLGRELGVDFVLVGELEAWTSERKDRKEEVREVRTRGRAGTDSVYVIERYTLVLRGTVSYALVDPGTQRVVARGSRTASVDDRVAEGRYAGDPATLLLDRDDLRYFDEEALAEQRRALEDDLVAELAARVAEAAFDDLLDRIP